MSKAVVDPDQMRKFSSQLDQSSKNLRDQKAAVIAGFSKLQETWRDDKYARFDQLFSESMRALERYIQESERYSTFLKQKAQRAQRYMDQR
jgi:uncharacterized protein YukE